jgi:hypothetical protein
MQRRKKEKRGKEKREKGKKKADVKIGKGERKIDE